MPPRFLDTKVLLQYLTRDDEAKARAALALLVRLERGEERVITSPLVMFETVFTLEKSYRVSRADIRERLSDIISLRGLQLANKGLYYRALDLYVSKNISFADAFNAVYARRHRATEVYSWDADFDRIEGLVRMEPEE